MGFDSTEIRFRSIATWICPSSVLSIPENEATPMILLLVANADVPARLEKHLGSPENSWRMTRIQNSPSWIYLDLAHVLGHWSDVWLRVQRALIYRDAQTHGKIQGPPVLQFTRQLHRDNANIIVLQENLRLHIAALERFEQFVKRSQQWEPKLVAEDHQDELNERIENLLGSLRNYQETSNVVLQQWKTLLSLVGTEQPKPERIAAHIDA
ncbi:hypothetical protein BGW36DRAFT_367370 [Talaromyces proteolyticus]|uniref:Uncharacterized protein n=1 Tax=Talaromyces proteolyticus TaxID=1131652 RepID=A0AAD4L7D9_9EURO|nr:uncharacterized protein BGW36DRAFT_367370 [Talaromyces proteolyticus]KAH8705334.1 hypothetical protein BGW36DRAFT_367370 [Talaromyces proteolyticus]